MKIRRFIAKETRIAMRQVRDELGPDAVILSNRRIPGGVEVMTAIDYDENLMSRHNRISENDRKGQVIESNQDASEITNNPSDVMASNLPEKKEDLAINAMQVELQNLRNLLEHQLSGLAWNDLKTRKPLEAELLKRFLILGLEHSFARKMAAQIIKIMSDSLTFNEVWSEAMDKLAALIPICGNDILEKSEVIALVGSTGVGKTTTLAKLATKYVMEHGPSGLGLITLDGNRIGAAEHLKAYARILGVQCRVIENENTLLKAMDSFYDKKLILIDTPGMNDWQKMVGEQFDRIKNVAKIDFYLVISATAQHSVLNENIKSFQGRNLKGCFLTKIDEAVSLGEVISVLIQNDLPLAYVADGQKVPEDIQLASAHQLVTRAVQIGHAEAGEKNIETLALQMTGLVADAY